MLWNHSRRGLPGMFQMLRQDDKGKQGAENGGQGNGRHVKTVQRHHISYDPEVTVFITKGEHLILTRMQWFCRRVVSKGFLKALTVFIRANKDRAIDLEGEYNARTKTK
jgi:hypothetical protein